MTRADLTTWGRNILPSPKRSPTMFIPVIRCPSITSSGRLTDTRASSISWVTNSSMPLTRLWLTRSCSGSSRHSFLATLPSRTSDLTLSAKSSSRSVASSRRLSSTSSTRSKRSFGMSSYTSSMLGFTIPMLMPCLMAWYKKAECMASRMRSLPLNEKLTLETPPLTWAWCRFSRIHLVALKKSRALVLCSSMPVATGNMLGSKMMSSGLKCTLSTKMR